MYSAVLARFISRMLAGQQPVIYGDGEQSRDFTFVENVINANLLACQAPAPEVAGRFFNIATNRRTTLNQTFALLQGLTGYRGTAQYGPERAGDIKHSLADITLAGERLRYAPAVDFEEGLKRTVAWYRDRTPSQSPSLSLAG